MTTTRTSNFWSRAIALVDMDAFFASVEQYDHPQWRGQPVVVTNGAMGTCIITSSYEARHFGIKTGMRLRDAYQRCPHLIRAPSRPNRYVAVSTAIMQALQNISPDIEIFSIDEAFLDLTHCQRLHGSAIIAAKKIKEVIFRASGLHCSVGLSGDKTTAKYAAQLQKPNGFTVIPPWLSTAHLQTVPVKELCGIGHGVARFLARYGVLNCGDMHKIPMQVLAQRFGNVGRRLWLMCQGLDPDPVHTILAPPKSMGHGKVLPPGTADPKTIATYLQHMAEKLGARLRRHHMQAQYFFIGIKNPNQGWDAIKQQTIVPTDCGRDIYGLSQTLLTNFPSHGIASQVQITALDPRAGHQQLDLFSQPDYKQDQLNQLMDAVNERFGEFSLLPARLLQRSKMPNVIAPSWQPSGHRNH